MADYPSSPRPDGTQSAPSQRLAYDPDMDVNEVRQLRSKYRDLLSTQAGSYRSFARVSSRFDANVAVFNSFGRQRPVPILPISRSISSSTM